jgi:hypothetical protein
MCRFGWPRGPSALSSLAPIHTLACSLVSPFATLKSDPAGFCVTRPLASHLPHTLAPTDLALFGLSAWSRVVTRRRGTRDAQCVCLAESGRMWVPANRSQRRRGRVKSATDRGTEASPIRLPSFQPPEKSEYQTAVVDTSTTSMPFAKHNPSMSRTNTARGSRN